MTNLEQLMASSEQQFVEFEVDPPFIHGEAVEVGFSFHGEDADGDKVTYRML
jgi:hypothetical protein